MSVRILMLVSAICLGCAAGCDRLAGASGGAPAASTAGTAAAPAAAAKPTGGVGVVDLDAVARQLGRDVEMNSAVKERLRSLNEDLNSLKESLATLYEERRAKFGDEMDDAQKNQLATMQNRMNSQLADTKRKADNELVTLKQQLIDQFREQTKPILKEVAASRGLSIVVPKNNGLLLTIDPGVEITDEVVQKMLASQSNSGKSSAKPKKAKPSSSTDTSAR